MRLSITDRCNLRCRYCMPDGIKKIPMSQIMSYEEMIRLCRAASELGITRIKITGGEPLVRLGCTNLVREIKRLPEIEQVTMTTNGILMGKMAGELRAAGLDAIMIRGLIALILDKGWEDKEYLEKYTTGWEKAVNWYRDFNYREAFDLAGVPLKQMEEFCHILTTTTWGVHQDLGLFFGRHSTLDSYLLYELMAVTGNLEIKGNKTMDSFARFAQTKYDERNYPNMWRTVETNLFPVVDQYPTTVLSDEILSTKKDHLRAMITVKGNPARSYPDVNRMAKALDSLELMVSIDIVMTETARHADYVLPGMTGFEEYHWGMF